MSEVYKCVRCGQVSPKEEWERSGSWGAFKCPYCSYKIAKKTRPPVVKRIKSR